MVKKWIGKSGIRQFCLMVVGNVLLAMGVSIFKLAGLGNDPFSGMTMAISEYMGILYGTFLICLNIFLFLIEGIFGRKMIGPGTLVNACLQGYFVMFFNWMWSNLEISPTDFSGQILVMVLGVGVEAFGLSLYQSSDAGLSPYDSLSFIVSEKIPSVPYFFSRVLIDGICAIVCWRFGGMVGLGMLTATFGIGPLAGFFNTYISEKRMGEKPVSASGVCE